MRVISGVQPSGRLHLGNFLGTCRQLVALQAEHEVFVFVADLHALNSVRDGGALRALSRQMAGDLLAVGVDPGRACLFVQSQVAAHAQLAWMLGALCPMALLERAHSYKDKRARGQAADLGLFAYPVLQAADILAYRAEAVPVGPDQRQHLEIARDLAVKFNLAHVPGFDANRTGAGAPGVLVPPEAIIAHAAAVPGTDGQKMSKSYGNTIDLFGSDKELRRQIMGIVTDSTPIEAPKPEGGALWELLMLVCCGGQRDEVAAAWRAGGTGYGDLKKRLLEAVLDLLAPMRARRRQLDAHPAEVDDVLKAGARRARLAAQPVLEAVAEAAGLLPPPPVEVRA